MKLPYGERANLGTKLEDYSLNPLHRDSRNKARVFDAVLGLTLANNAEVLRDALLNAATYSDSAEPRGDNGFGDVYIYQSGKGLPTYDSSFSSAFACFKSTVSNPYGSSRKDHGSGRELL